MRMYVPLIARTKTMYQSLDPVAYDCVKVIFVRDGSAILSSHFGQRSVKVGDIVVLSANILCGSEPENLITTTTIYLDTDYVIDQVFWQYAGFLRNRLDAQQFTETIYNEPAQVLRIGKSRLGLLIPWLDELVARSIDGGFESHFYRMQALWFAIADVMTPFVKFSPVRDSPTQRANHSRPTQPRERSFVPIRDEARRIREILKMEISGDWTLKNLSTFVHLSPKQLSRVFTDTFGKTPLAYLTMLRVEEMARLLRETELSVTDASRRVGWSSRSRAIEAFSEYVGMSPNGYRQLYVKGK